MRRYTVTVGDQSITIDVHQTAADEFEITVGDRTFEARVEAEEDLPGTRIEPGIPMPDVARAVAPARPQAPAPNGGAPSAPVEERASAAPVAVGGAAPAAAAAPVSGAPAAAAAPVSGAPSAAAAPVSGAPSAAAAPVSGAPVSGAPVSGGLPAPDGAPRAEIVPAPMPGVVLEVHAVVGAAVRRGDPLLVLEAMKMRNAIRAPRDGVVTAVAVEAGQPVRAGDVLVRLAKGAG